MQEKECFGSDSLLHLSASKGHHDICKLLIGHAVDLNSTDHEGQTPLHWSAKNGHQGVCKLLIDDNMGIIQLPHDHHMSF